MKFPESKIKQSYPFQGNNAQSELRIKAHPVNVFSRITKEVTEMWHLGKICLGSVSDIGISYCFHVKFVRIFTSRVDPSHSNNVSYKLFPERRQPQFGLFAVHVKPPGVHHSNSRGNLCECCSLQQTNYQSLR